MKIEEITVEEVQTEYEKRKLRGHWQQVIEAILKGDGKPRKISDLTRGQVAALYRAAKSEGLTVIANYKEGYVILSGR
jgi:hypothetical protein